MLLNSWKPSVFVTLCQRSEWHLPTSRNMALQTVVSRPHYLNLCLSNCLGLTASFLPHFNLEVTLLLGQFWMIDWTGPVNCLHSVSHHSVCLSASVRFSYDISLFHVYRCSLFSCRILHSEKGSENRADVTGPSAYVKMRTFQHTSHNAWTQYLLGFLCGWLNDIFTLWLKPSEHHRMPRLNLKHVKLF